MKKSISKDNHQDGQEQSKKLYRSISDSAKQLDDAHSCAQNVGDLFTPILQIRRSRFQEFCERLIFADPTLFGRKAEELLWRKAYYDVIAASKKLKNKDYSDEILSSIQTHINAGIGHYHHFISRIQHHYNIDVADFVDFAIFKQDFKKSTNIKPDQLDWAKQSIHRCLIYLGDLNRYKLEIYPNLDTGLAIRYYLSSVRFKPDYGMPHNQMGTLVSIQNRTLDAVYHYMCCLACKYPFEGSENNLLRIFEKNCRTLEEFPGENSDADCIVQLESSQHIKRLISRFLLLIETWYFNKTLTDIYILCHQTNVDLQECLSYSKPMSSDTEDLDSIDTDSIFSPAYLTDDAILKISVISLLCIAKLQKLQFATQLSTAIAFTLAIYSQLLQIATDHIQDAIMNLHCCTSDLDSLPNITNGKTDESKPQKSKAKNKARRRRKKYSSEEDSDVSDVEIVALDSSSDISREGSEDEAVLSSSDNESGDEIKVNGTENTTDSSTSQLNGGSPVQASFNYEQVKTINPHTLIDIIAEEKLLQSIKVLSDWFGSDMEIVKSCGKTTRSLLKQITQLLNLLNVDLDSLKLVDDEDKLQPLQDEGKNCLPEDITLNGIEIICNTRKSYDYIYTKQLSVKDETLVRISKLRAFGHALAKVDETGITFDETKQMFEIQMVEEVNTLDVVIENSIVEPDNESPLNEIKSIETKQSKMKHMGQLWLAAEVRALENRVKSKTSLSPYLVLDADCLTQSIPVVKHLVNCKKFIVVVPSAVVSVLDDLKKDKLEARDAIRWLELQFHHGNRFCRAQRPQESTALPLIRYPKKKDKEAFAFIQIIECCYYLTQQQKNSSNLVTLLLGNKIVLSNNDNKDFSYLGLAHSVGINLEFVSDFYDKWKKNKDNK